MAFNLVDSFKSLITLEVVDKAAAQFGENQAGISKAISGVVPVILAGFVHHAQTGNASSLLQEAKDAASNNLSNFSEEGSSVLSRGEDWLNRLYGNRAGTIGDSLAGFAGIKTTSAHSLLAMLVPAGLAVIGKHALDNNLSEDGFRSFFSEQRSNIKSAIPAGLNVDLDNWLDRDEDHRASTTAPTTTATSTAHHAASATAHHHTTRKPRSANWVLILIVLLLVIALVWYFLMRDNGVSESGAGASDTTSIMVTLGGDLVG